MLPRSTAMLLLTQIGHQPSGPPTVARIDLVSNDGEHNYAHVHILWCMYIIIVVAVIVIISSSIIT